MMMYTRSHGALRRSCFSRSNVLGGVAAALVSLSPQALQAAEGSGPISDFMTMDVCTQSDGSVAMGKIPGSPDCSGRRNIKPGEQPTYILQNFSGPRSKCAGGAVTKVNIPVTIGANTRITSSTFKAGCAGPQSVDDVEGAEDNGLSIQWYDKGYGFLMGSYSPVALSTFESDQCADSGGTSRRFFRGWVIAPATVPARGESGYGVFPSKLHNGQPSELPVACATRYNRGLTTWAVDDFTYKSDRRLLSIVSSHYSRSGEDGKGPGKAMQVEQTYWTREFGLSRWEKWAREDWVHPRSQKSAADLAQRLVSAGRCSRPELAAVRYNANLQVSGVSSEPNVYSRLVTDPSSGESHVWYMTLCEDYTNASPAAPKMDYIKSINGLANDIYWR